jgi:hypothetical protein
LLAPTSLTKANLFDEDLPNRRCKGKYEFGQHGSTRCRDKVDQYHAIVADMALPRAPPGRRAPPGCRTPGTVFGRLCDAAGRQIGLTCTAICTAARRLEVHDCLQRSASGSSGQVPAGRRPRWKTGYAAAALTGGRRPWTASGGKGTPDSWHAHSAGIWWRWSDDLWPSSPFPRTQSSSHCPKYCIQSCPQRPRPSTVPSLTDALDQGNANTAQGHSSKCSNVPNGA